MCGIVGFIERSHRFGNDELRATVLNMANTLRHRGPDDSGAWTDAEIGIALGHRRLSILDLSPEGHQPMRSSCGRYVVSFNGEIYNFQALRSELEDLGYGFRGHSDTEVMLACMSQWGLLSAVKRFNGMFAFALWDREERRLHLVRDRLGEKPLYYGWMGKIFLFGSELKSLRAHNGFQSEVNRDALTLYLRHNYIPAPYSIYRNIHKVQPGAIVTIDPVDGVSPVSTCYWSARAAAEQGVREPFLGDEREAVAHLDALLRDAVKLRMQADVPLGAFLSGGIDSSTIVALMQAQSDRPVQTFTVGFYEDGYNEAHHANAVAEHLATQHTELYVRPEEAMAVIPRLPILYDEPFSDASQIPTFLISELARRDVTVSLSGDAGDELFAGYNRYFLGRNIWNKIKWMPFKLRVLAARSLRGMSPQSWERLVRRLAPVLPKAIRQRNPGDKIHKLAEILTVQSPETFYLGLVSHWRSPASLVLQASEPTTVLSDHAQWADLSDFTHRMMYLDMMTYLPDDILVKVDRASMGVSLEARVPFLDHRVVEFAWRLPVSMNVRQDQGKWLLRQLLHRYVPKALVERPKMGFGVPLHAWLRGPLREWAEDLLDEKQLRDQGFFDPKPIRELWTEHLSGARDWQYRLWVILMFQAWLEHEQHAA
ncbi:MAG: asparagine synthase (glutamine-hydrolyzing) [Nitrospiraceae bacterium]